MASAIIHICVAKLVNEKLNKNSNLFYLGSIAPDISKQINESKIKSHFLNNDIDNIPDCKRFINKYANKLNKPFVLGYLTHLVTDYYWFKYFINKYKEKDEIDNYIYSDYTILNYKLINYFELELKLFYNQLDLNFNEIEEIDESKLQILIDKMSELIMESYDDKLLIFKEEDVLEFISDTANKIIQLYNDILN